MSGNYCHLCSVVRYVTPSKPTIYEALRAKLKREPTHAELKADVKRVLNDGLIEQAEQGKLKHQRGRI